MGADIDIWLCLGFAGSSFSSQVLTPHHPKNGQLLLAFFISGTTFANIYSLETNKMLKPNPMGSRKH
jgi:hypothetical protein